MRYHTLLFIHVNLSAGYWSQNTFWSRQILANSTGLASRHWGWTFFSLFFSLSLSLISSSVLLFFSLGVLPAVWPSTGFFRNIYLFLRSVPWEMRVFSGESAALVHSLWTATRARGARSRSAGASERALLSVSMSCSCCHTCRRQIVSVFDRDHVTLF